MTSTNKYRDQKGKTQANTVDQKPLAITTPAIQNSVNIKYAILFSTEWAYDKWRGNNYYYSTLYNCASAGADLAGVSRIKYPENVHPIR